MQIKIRHKLLMILLWLMISVGIYQCGKWEEKQQGIHQKQEELAEEKGQGIQDIPEIDENIRVLIRNSDYAGLYHQELILSSEEGLICKVGQQYYECTPQQKLLLTAKQLLDKEAAIWTKQNGLIRLENVARNEEVQYRGSMECYGTNEGIILVNELPVEEYLYGVVPSEMPSSYPLEALKAQAIGARTYAYYHKQSYAYPTWKAHVDDSTTYQVYGNIAETEEASRAIDETNGQIMMCNGELIESFYYATSSGYGSGYEVWGTDEQKEYLTAKALSFPQETVQASATTVYERMSDEKSYRSFIDHGNKADVEYKEAWYRWKYDTSVNGEELLQKLYDMSLVQPDTVMTVAKNGENTEKLLTETEIKNMKIVERLESGLANQLEVETENYTIHVNTQYAIRQLLSNTGEKVIRQDGTEFVLGELLPSAYFYMDCIYEDCKTSEISYVKGISIRGGGFGHGAGMSQNGAKCLAQNGFKVEDILQYYYQNIEIVNAAKLHNQIS